MIKAKKIMIRKHIFTILMLSTFNLFASQKIFQNSIEQSNPAEYVLAFIKQRDEEISTEQWYVKIYTHSKRLQGPLPPLRLSSEGISSWYFVLSRENLLSWVAFLQDNAHRLDLIEELKNPIILSKDEPK